MDQASASPEASCAHNPVAPRTSSSCSRSVDRSRTGGPPHARSGPQCEPHAAPSNRDSRPSSPAPCRLKAKGYLLPEFYSGATGRSGRFNEGLLLRRLHLETLEELKGIGYVADAEFGLEITEKGRAVRQTINVRPREGLINKISKIVSVKVNVSLKDLK